METIGWVVLGGVGGVLLTLAVTWLLLRRAARPRELPPPGASVLEWCMGPDPANRGTADATEIAQLRQNLRVKTLHNEGLIDRLVQAERERSPSASEVECYRAAIRRWERENR